MKKTTLLAAATMLFAGSLFAGETQKNMDPKLKEALQGGKVKGTIGTYFEHKDYKEMKKDSLQWQTGYFNLKYESLRWHGLKLGASLLAHTKIDDDFDEDDKSVYDKDIEEKYTLPELYLDWNFAGKSSLRLGRFNHKKFTHIDDAQSEGIYFQSKDIENLTLSIGGIREFAELDYDDGEDFGRSKGQQNLSKDEFYPNSDNYLFFAEAKYKVDNFMFNPYFMTQDGYASVLGADADVSGKLNDCTKIGLKAKAYNVYSHRDDYDNALCYSLAPYLKVGGFSVEVGYAAGDGDGDSNKKAMNKPTWMRDHLTGFDQDAVFGGVEQGAKGQWVKLGYKVDGWKFHVAHGVFSQEEGMGMRNTNVDETEFIVGYKFENGLDLQGRYFMVDFNDFQYDENDDYNKIEVRCRYRF